MASGSTSAMPTNYWRILAMSRHRWAAETGLPTQYGVRAALHVASVLDARGSRVMDARESYWHHATGGIFGPEDMELGEELLRECGLVEERGDVLFPTEELQALLDGSYQDAVTAVVARALKVTEPDWLSEGEISSEVGHEKLGVLIEDPRRREEMLIALGLRFDSAVTEAVGEMGEIAVVEHARNELIEMGHLELAREVRRVSLLSDQLGYDVVAPRVIGNERLLEIKTYVGKESDPISFFLSRNEARVGMRYEDWSLVFCRATSSDAPSADVVGWVPFESVKDLLPEDSSNGRWEVAHVTIPGHLLNPDIPLP